MKRCKVALICGIHGQDGSYLAQFLVAKGYVVFGTSRSVTNVSSDNLSKLGVLDLVTVLPMRPEDIDSVRETLGICCPDEVYYLAGQSSVGLSFSQPRETMQSIVMATLNILEVCRQSHKDVRFYQAGSSECFGDTLGVPATESTPFSPRSPYGVAKASAFWLVDNYRASYGLFACTGILFNHESPLRPSTFVTQKIIAAANNIANGSTEMLTLGRLDIQRDWGWAPEYIEAMWLMLQQEVPEDFVIATGKTHSLVDFVQLAFDAHGLDWKDHVVQSEEFSRPSDLSISNANPSRAFEKLSWKAKVDMPSVVANMLAGKL
jgi:GDPmannose 4,6-dehydratase